MTRALASLSVVVAVTGCMAGMAGHAAQPPPPTPAPQATETAAPGGMAAMDMQACPMSVPGTQVAAAETPDGESITFTTSPNWAADLRARVHGMADVHNRHHQGGGMEGTNGGMQHEGMMGGGSMGPSGAGADQMAMMPPPSRATVEDVEGGALIVVTPNDPADLDRLRSAVRMHAEHMQQTGACEMGRPGHM